MGAFIAIFAKPVVLLEGPTLASAESIGFSFSFKWEQNQAHIKKTCLQCCELYIFHENTKE